MFAYVERSTSKPSLLEHAMEFGQTIPPPVMADVVLQSPQKHERRHEQQHMSTGPQHAAHFLQPGEIVVHVLDDVECGYEIKRAIFVRQFFARAEFDLIESTRATKRERVFRNSTPSA